MDRKAELLIAIVCIGVIGVASAFVSGAYASFMESIELKESSQWVPEVKVGNEPTQQRYHETHTPIEMASTNLVSTQKDKATSWNKTHLRILIRTEGVLQIEPDLRVVEAVGSAVDQWRRSIEQFTESNPETFYLGSLVFTVYVQGENDTSLRGVADIDIRFTDKLSSPLIGGTKLSVTNLHSIRYAEIIVGLQDLSPKGLRNVLTHELGHALGLEHSVLEEDLMYSERETSEAREEILCPSTLDLYALALTYQWIETGSYSPYNDASVTLPQAMKYESVACNLQ